MFQIMRATGYENTHKKIFLYSQSFFIVFQEQKVSFEKCSEPRNMALLQMCHPSMSRDSTAYYWEAHQSVD